MAISHRTWPTPRLPWIMAQTWHDLLFAHWRVPHESLRPHVPRQLDLQRRDGSAWLGVVAFEIEGLRLRGLPPAPGMGRFAELNVRTYVTDGRRPGVYFFSLDAASLSAVIGARTLLGLPYRHAEMSIERRGADVDYVSARKREPAVRFRGSYAPEGPVFEAARGSLEEWLTERYCLYTTIAGVCFCLDIDHPAWPLQAARASIEENTMAGPLGIALSGEPLLHFAKRQDVIAWAPTPVRRLA
jgi:uncharacterized protein YqjF (DUF2071 family)